MKQPHGRGIQRKLQKKRGGSEIPTILSPGAASITCETVSRPKCYLYTLRSKRRRTLVDFFFFASGITGYYRAEPSDQDQKTKKNGYEGQKKAE